MELTPQQAGRSVVLLPSGRIDHANAERFAAALAPHLRDCRAEGPSLVVDFSAVTFISSIGLRALMIAIKQVKAQGGRMVLCALSPLVDEVFRISRFDLLFDLYPTRAEAVAAAGVA